MLEKLNEITFQVLAETREIKDLAYEYLRNNRRKLCDKNGLISTMRQLEKCNGVLRFVNDKEKGDCMRTYTIRMLWDDGVWYTSTDSPLSLTLNSTSYDELVERVRLAAPEMIELNSNYTGEIQLVFVSERREMVSA